MLSIFLPQNGTFLTNSQLQINMNKISYLLQVFPRTNNLFQTIQSRCFAYALLWHGSVLHLFSLFSRLAVVSGKQTSWSYRAGSSIVPTLSCQQTTDLNQCVQMRRSAALAF